jgi:hypothetical protein
VYGERHGCTGVTGRTRVRSTCTKVRFLFFLLLSLLLLTSHDSAGVNEQTKNIMTLHTAQGCYRDSVSSFTGDASPSTSDCYVRLPFRSSFIFCSPDPFVLGVRFLFRLRRHRPLHLVLRFRFQRRRWRSLRGQTRLGGDLDLALGSSGRTG